MPALDSNLPEAFGEKGGHTPIMNSYASRGWLYGLKRLAHIQAEKIEGQPCHHWILCLRPILDLAIVRPLLRPRLRPCSRRWLGVESLTSSAGLSLGCLRTSTFGGVTRPGGPDIEGRLAKDSGRVAGEAFSRLAACQTSASRSRSRPRASDWTSSG